MYNIEVPKRVNQLFSVYYLMGIWSESRTGLLKWAPKILYLTVYGSWPITLLLGAYYYEGNFIEALFLLVMAVPGIVITFRIYFLLFKKTEIFEYVRQLGVHSIKDREEFNKINKDINFLTTFSTLFHVMIVFALASLTIISLPFLTSEKRLPMNTYIPCDWNNNEICYWMAYGYITFIFTLSVICTPFTAIVWYLMMSCVSKYKLLGFDFKNAHVVFEESKERLTKNKVSVVKNKDLVLMNLIALIQKHQSLQESTQKIKSFFSTLYLIQIGTSALTICGSVYILAFVSTENIFQYLVYVCVATYQFFDIFMVTYYGNEIKIWSSRLSYSLFESNWMDQSKTFKKTMFILMEVLKRPQEFVIGKLYPLDLEIFSNILNASYSMFNILKNMK